MIKYCDIDFYINFFGAGIPEELINRYLYKAQSEIENYCANSIRTLIVRTIGKNLQNYENATIDEINEDYNIFSSFEIERIKIAICELANFLYENEDAISGIATSITANGASISFSKSDVLSTKNHIISNELSQTRFLNATY